MHMLHAKKLDQALESFSRAIREDPRYLEAYFSRSMVLNQLGRAEEADADVRRAYAIKSENNSSDTRDSPTTVHRIDLDKVDSIYDDLAGEDELDFDDDLYDYVFSDDSLESESLLDTLATPHTASTGFPAILEYLNGTREEIPWTHLFTPTEDQLTLVRSEGAEGTIISFDQLSCIKLTRVPSGFARNRDADCHVEIIETVDGNIYHEYVSPVQDRKNVLYGFSTKKDSRFKYTFIPVQNIKKRFQRRHLGQILMDKKFVSSDVLQNMLQEHNELKKTKFGRILAEQARILYPAVESEIQKAYSKGEHKKGRKVGEILVNAGLVNEEQIDQALAYQKRLQNRKLGHFLVEKGILQEKDLYLALSEKFRIPFVDLREQKGSKKVISLLPRELIQKLKILPLHVKENTLVIATLLPDPSSICEVILKYSPLKDIEFVLAQPSHIKNVINVLFPEKK